MFDLFFQKLLRDNIIPYNRGMLTIQSQEVIITLPIIKLSAHSLQINDVICLDDLNLITNKKLLFIDYLSLDSNQQFIMDHEKFIDVAKKTIYDKQNFRLTITSRTVYNNNIIITANSN